MIRCHVREIASLLKYYVTCAEELACWRIVGLRYLIFVDYGVARFLFTFVG